jgi:hypothetical protein
LHLPFIAMAGLVVKPPICHVERSRDISHYFCGEKSRRPENS